MKGWPFSYWGRMLVAWVLLKAASTVVKDAENLLRQSAQREELPERHSSQLSQVTEEIGRAHV